MPPIDTCPPRSWELTWYCIPVLDVLLTCSNSARQPKLTEMESLLLRPAVYFSHSPSPGFPRNCSTLTESVCATSLRLGDVSRYLNGSLKTRWHQKGKNYSELSKFWRFDDNDGINIVKPYRYVRAYFLTILKNLLFSLKNEKHCYFVLFPPQSKDI